MANLQTRGLAYLFAVTFLCCSNEPAAKRTVPRTTVSPKQTTEVSVDTVLANVGRVVENLLDAYNKSDFQRMAKDFSKKMAIELPVRKLATVASGVLKPKYGDFVLGSKKFHSIENKGDFRVVRFLCRFTKGNVYATVSIKSGDPETQVQGFWLKPAPTKLTTEQAASFLTTAKPVADNILSALIAKDYGRATRDFSVGMAKSLGPEKLKARMAAIEAKYGALKSCAYWHAVRKGAFIALLYRCQFSTAGAKTYRIVFRSADMTRRVSGLWLR